MTNFAIEGVTLNGNKVIQYNGFSIYTTQSGRPISFEPSWFEIENPFFVSVEYAEYLLNLTEQKMLRDEEEEIKKEQEIKDKKKAEEIAERVEKIKTLIYRVTSITLTMEDNPMLLVKYIFPEVEEEAIMPLFYHLTRCEFPIDIKKPIDLLSRIPFQTENEVRNGNIYQKRSYYYYQYGKIAEIKMACFANTDFFVQL
jgi:hypothetical protein